MAHTAKRRGWQIGRDKLGTAHVMEGSKVQVHALGPTFLM